MFLLLAAQLCPTLLQPMDFSLPGSSLYGISQARILEWVAISFPRGSSQPRDQTQISLTEGRFFTICTTQGSPEIKLDLNNSHSVDSGLNVTKS